MADDEHSVTTNLLKASRFWAAVRGNPQVVWAIISSVLTATIVGTTGVVIFQQSVKVLKEHQTADENKLAEISTKISSLAENGPRVTNDKLDSISYRVQLQEEWRNQVEAGAEIRVTRKRK